MIQANTMSQTERLQAMEELWDNICHDEPLPESPAWHGSVLEQRRSRIEAGEAEYVSLDELKATRR